MHDEMHASVDLVGVSDLVAENCLAWVDFRSVGFGEEGDGVAFEN